MRYVLNSIILFFKRLRSFFKNYNIFNYAAQLSYGLMLAFLPMIMLFNWFLRAFFSDMSTTSEFLEFIENYLPKSLASLILSSIDKVQIDLSAGLSSILGNIALLVFIIYACIRLMRSIMVVSTNICKIKEGRHFIVLWLLAVRNLIVILVFLALFIYVFLESRLVVVDYIRRIQDPIAAKALEWLWNRTIYLHILVATILLLNWIIAKAPAKPLKFRRAFPGTFLIIFGWGFLVTIFHYIYEYISYDGILQFVDSGITIVITIYLISLILLLGVLVNNKIYQLNEERANNETKNRVEKLVYVKSKF